MSEYNSCADLTEKKEFKYASDLYRNLLDNGIDPFSYMLNMQLDLQIALSKKSSINSNPQDLKTIGEKFEWLRDNKQSFDDEYREIIDALPGMNLPEKDRSAVWKKWKTKYTEIRSRTFDDLSENEIKELKYELCDSFHFFMNMFFAIDMSAKDMFIYYYSKNAENHNRINNGY